VYAAGEVDALAAYCPSLDRCYFLPVAEFPGRTEITLQSAAPRKAQRMGVNWAADFEFGARLPVQVGAVAQLGERLAGSQKVTGSSPVGSTSRGRREAVSLF
jgi:hypothetical protein